MRRFLSHGAWCAARLSAAAPALELTGLAAEGRVFPRPAAHRGQGSASASFVAQPELYHDQITVARYF